MARHCWRSARVVAYPLSFVSQAVRKQDVFFELEYVLRKWLFIIRFNISGVNNTRTAQHATDISYTQQLTPYIPLIRFQPNWSRGSCELWTHTCEFNDQRTRTTRRCYREIRKTGNIIEPGNVWEFELFFFLISKNSRFDVISSRFVQ